jgi:DNA-binding SARP family transcriptional activator
MASVHAGTSAPVRFGILGSLTVHLNGALVPLGPVKQQLVLALLLCRANTATPVELLTETLWEDEPPRTARKNLQVYVASLRKLLGETGRGDRITHGFGGYRLRADPAELDALLFAELVAGGRRAGHTDGPAAAAAVLSDALDLWRGPMLEGLCDVASIRREKERLTGRFLSAFEDWAEAELATGNAFGVVERVCEVASQHPFRERLRGVQMTALYLCERRTEALSVFDELRQSLARELGLEPSARLGQLYRSLLTGERMPAAVGIRAPRIPARASLPPDLPDFTGRTEQVRELSDALSRSGRVAVLTGPAGAGKTAIAVHVAHLLADRFPGGQLFVPLYPDDGTQPAASAALASAMQAAGLPGPRPAGVREAAAAWRAWLLEHRILLVLDDVGDQAAVQALLPVAGGSAAVLTGRSRRAALDVSRRIEVPSFSVPEAVELLARIVSDNRVDGDPSAAERIVTAAGLLPAAVRAAGRKLAFLRHLPLAEFAARLDDGEMLLDELSAGDDGLRVRLGAWLNDLPVAERGALRRLGALPSPMFTLDQAAAALGADTGPARRMLESLIEANAVAVPLAEVTAHAALYEIPPLLRCYLRGSAGGAV